MIETINPFELKFERSDPGRSANARGKLIGTLLGRISGAERAGDDNDNLWSINGGSVRFHSVSGGKSSFTLNPSTEPPRLIVALTQDKPDGDKPLRYWLYGLRLEACSEAGRPAKSTSAPGRLIVLVGQIRDRVELGYADLAAQYVETKTVPDRDAAMVRINELTPEALASMMDAATRQNIREFVMAGRPAITGLSTPPTIEDAAPSIEQAPQEVIGESSSTEVTGGSDAA
jgi:hypothetical protein